MTTTNEILQYVSNKQLFTRKELFEYLCRQVPEIQESSISQQLNRLIKKGSLNRIERGVYSSGDAKTLFVPAISNELRELNTKIKTQFPFVCFCLWHSNILTPYMHHIPNLKYIFVEVERDALNSVFYFLNDNSSKRVFLTPDSDDYARYIAGNESIILRPLVSESPLQTVENIKMPTVEKILVDTVGDVDFEFMQGAEIVRFYHNILEKHIVNRSRLERYANRRNRRKEVELIYNAPL